MIIQIYEIQTPAEARLMVELGVDHVGSVLTSTEKTRDNDLKSTVKVVQEAGCKSSIIPLFGDVEMICEALDFYKPDILHFCETLPLEAGHMDALDEVLQRQAAVRRRYPQLEIMRSIPMGETGRGNLVDSLKLARMFESISDWFLTDTLLSQQTTVSDQDQPVAGYVGITGKTCEWDIARQLVQTSKIPVILAGGIGPENVAAGIAHVAPAGVDSCTLTNAVDAEGKPRRFAKDPQKVKRMIRNARNGDKPK